MKIVESIDEGQTGNWGFRRVVGNDGKVINIEQFLPVYKGTQQNGSTPCRKMELS